MMKKMGISQTELPAKEVIIRMDEGEIVILNPTVSKVNLMGQETFQITGDIHERTAAAAITDEDVKTVMEQAKTTAEKARQALEDNKGDIAAAILALKEQ